MSLSLDDNSSWLSKPHSDGAENAVGGGKAGTAGVVAAVPPKIHGFAAAYPGLQQQCRCRGVNIVARLEGIAEPGGIYLSG
jgi:hypothetical protein